MNLNRAIKRVGLASILLMTACVADAKAEADGITVIVSRQSAEGITREKMDASFLSLIESYSKARIVQLAKEHEISQGRSGTGLSLNSDATYFEYASQKLAVIRFTMPSKEYYSVMIGGLIGGQFARVTCQHLSSKRIPITYGSCGKKVEEVFGLRF